MFRIILTNNFYLRLLVLLFAITLPAEPISYAGKGGIWSDMPSAPTSESNAKARKRMEKMQKEMQKKQKKKDKKKFKRDERRGKSEEGMTQEQVSEQALRGEDARRILDIAHSRNQTRKLESSQSAQELKVKFIPPGAADQEGIVLSNQEQKVNY